MTYRKFNRHALGALLVSGIVFAPTAVGHSAYYHREHIPIQPFAADDHPKGTPCCDIIVAHPGVDEHRLPSRFTLSRHLLAPIDAAISVFDDSLSYRYHNPQHRHHRHTGYACRVYYNGHGHLGRTTHDKHCAITLPDETLLFQHYKVLHR